MGSLSLKNVSNFNSKKSIKIDGLDFEMKDKEFVILTGSNNCGKSTVLKIIAGLEKVSQGDVFIGNELVNDLPYKKRDVVMISEDYSLKKNKTVFDNLSFELKGKNISDEEKNNKVKEIAEILNLSHLLNRKLKSLSEGQRQRVALGRAVAGNPEAVLIDDPLSNYDKKLRYQMVREIINIRKNFQTTLLYSTNDQSKIANMNAKVVIMKNGEILQQGSIQDIYYNPVNLFVAGFIGNPQMNFIKTKIVAKRKTAILVIGEDSIILPEKESNLLREKGYIGKEVVIGIRPEDIYYTEESIKNHNTSVIQAEAEVTESIGDKTFLYATKGRNNFLIKADSTLKVKPGENISLAVDENKVHIFDKETEKAII